MTQRVRSEGDAERFLPETHGALMTHEHVHRYALAASLLSGARVLDLGSGAGYGTRLLRAAGARVVPLDLDAAAVRRAEPGVRGSATALPFADGRFDAAVCFEMIEHVPEPERVVAEIARVVAADGVALISTPDREIYTDRAGNRNRYHLRELTRAEFAAMLARHFACVALYGQSVWAGSWIAQLDAAGAPPAGPARAVGVTELARDARARRAPWADPESGGFPTPLYVVAVCARDAAALARVRARLGDEQVLHDREQRVVGELYALAEALGERDREVASLGAHARNVESRHEEAASRVASLERHAANLEQQASAREARVHELERHAQNLEERLAQHAAHCEGLAKMVAQLQSTAAGHEAHAANLERLAEEREERVRKLELHAANLEKLVAERSARCEGLEAHAANLDRVLAERSAHVEGLLAHAANLERAIGERDARVAELERHAGDAAEEIRARRAASDDLAARLARAEASARELGDTLARLRAALWVRAGKRLGLTE
ncbi:MAG: hypothetical protein DCC71_01400 [Proteobacteria bacterium]|nr:MAG: hypothetical protein DCC71_01400 [Pseudomonadota bacterium]